MGRIRVSTIIDAPPVVVWDDVRHLASHVEWMSEAEAISFTSSTTEGAGTTFDCVTRIGPFRLLDELEVTRWRERHAIGIRHTGLITGNGRFTLRRARGGRTRFTWTERLRYPWWMGGPIGGVVIDEALRVIWRRNLRRLAERFA